MLHTDTTGNSNLEPASALLHTHNPIHTHNSDTKLLCMNEGAT
jgi:hypothetical protein